jgi:asparaginyl-tRNA synthetase
MASSGNPTLRWLIDEGVVGETYQARGWVRTKRDSKTVSFVALNDGSTITNLQVVVPSELEGSAEALEPVGTGASLSFRGELVDSPGKGQRVELVATEIEVIGLADGEEYPLQKKGHSFEFLRSIAHLRPRANAFGAVFRIRSTLAMATHRFFGENAFHHVHTPIITASDCEGAGELFRVSTLDALNPARTADGKVDFSQDFFGREAFLTVSGQLNVETYCMSLDKVYTFGPTFRAENSNTSRHLAEFWMIEPEIAFADLNDDADLAEDLLKYIFRALLNERQDDMEFFNQRIDKTCIERLEAFVDSSFERMEYTDAVAALKNSGKSFEFPVEWGVDLQSEHERWLTEEHAGRPVVVMNYPKEIKAFYMRLNDDGKTVAAMDVLAPGIGEIIGGAQREERLDVLDRRLAATGLPVEDYSWYRDLRKYGTAPHAGFGLGFERTISYATGLSNVRDVIPFPRTPNNASF